MKCIPGILHPEDDAYEGNAAPIMQLLDDTAKASERYGNFVQACFHDLYRVPPKKLRLKTRRFICLD